VEKLNSDHANVLTDMIPSSIPNLHNRLGRYVGISSALKKVLYGMLLLVDQSNTLVSTQIAFASFRRSIPTYIFFDSSKVHNLFAISFIFFAKPKFPE